MRKVLIGMIAVCMFTDCTGLKEITAPEQEQGNDFWKGPGVSTENDSSENVCYVTGIDYPSGWDWTDVENESKSVRCSLTVFAEPSLYVTLSVRPV